MFNYHQPNIESMQQYLKENESSENGEGVRWWNIPKGMSSVRILPPWDPTGRVALPVYMHPIEFKGKDMSYTKYNWTCVNKTFGKPCGICDGLAGIAAAGVDTSEWESNRRQFYFNAIVMHDPTYNEAKNEGTAPGTHVLMKAPKTFYDWVIAQITNPMIGDITSITNGIDVYITKEGSGLNTTYSMTLSPNGRTAIPQNYLEAITDLYNLDDIFSTGFDQGQINELIDSLSKSSGLMYGAVNTTVQQMGGYQQSSPAPQQFSQPSSIPTPPQFNPVPPMQQSVPTPPWENDPVPAPTATAPTSTPQASTGDKPKCFGQYDSGSVNCVVCPVEVDCSRMK